jgi:hypothetical protein
LYLFVKITMREMLDYTLKKVAERVFEIVKAECVPKDEHRLVDGMGR